MKEESVVTEKMNQQLLSASQDSFTQGFPSKKSATLHETEAQQGFRFLQHHVEFIKVSYAHRGVTTNKSQKHLNPSQSLRKAKDWWHHQALLFLNSFPIISGRKESWSLFQNVLSSVITKIPPLEDLNHWSNFKYLTKFKSLSTFWTQHSSITN